MKEMCLEPADIPYKLCLVKTNVVILIRLKQIFIFLKSN